MPEFGLIYEVAPTAPYDENEAAVFQDLVKQVQIAESVGFKSVWHVEHHFLRGFAHSSNNDVLLGAYASATSTIRLGYGVKLLPFAYNHPVRAAEAVATLDQISGGRVEFGTGRSFTKAEMGGFDIDPNTTRQQWEEALEIILAAWRNDTFSWDSPSYTIPERAITPKPNQKPHPPIWVAGTSPDSHQLAGELGIGLLSFSTRTPLDILGERIRLYKEAVAKCVKPVGDFVNDRIAPFTLIYCGETNQAAHDIAAGGVVEYIEKSTTLIADTVDWIANKGETPTYAYMTERFNAAMEAKLTFDELDSQDMVIVGDPETCRRKVQRYIDLGLGPRDILLGNFQAPGIPLDEVKKSIERFGKEVIPAFS